MNGMAPKVPYQEEAHPPPLLGSVQLRGGSQVSKGEVKPELRASLARRKDQDLPCPGTTGSDPRLGPSTAICPDLISGSEPVGQVPISTKDAQQAEGP